MTTDRACGPIPRPSLIRPLLAAALLVACARAAGAAQPSAGTLAPTGSDPLLWEGTATGPTNQTGEADCIEGTNCDTFELTLAGSPADWNGRRARIVLRWGSTAFDYDFYVHRESLGGPQVASGTSGVQNFEEDDIDPAEDGTGVFYVRVIYFAAVGAADQYHASAVTVSDASNLPPAPVASGPVPRYQVHTPRQDQVELGMARNVQDEPNLGVNWRTGNVLFQTLMQTNQVHFEDATCPSSPSSYWTDVTPPFAVQGFDPILFTDHDTHRTFLSHLLVNPVATASGYTEDDGATWIPTQGAGFGSGIDHQTLGGGPFHEPAPPGAAYRNAVYYCAQDIAFSNCALSVDGGITYGPAVPIYTLEQCSGLHGHVKVGPDGTAYVPNAACRGKVNLNENAVVVSEDNGLTWDVRTVPGTAGAGGSDPSVAIDDGGRVYLAFVDGDRYPSVAVSENQGRTWTNVFDIGAPLGIKSARFPAAVAGSDGRAAVAFYGTTAPGLGGDMASSGLWHLYVAHTYDGGASWITVDVTPDDPIQHGGIFLGGGASIHRNLLDFFDADLDQDGRMVVGYADGCVGRCAQAAEDARGNSYVAFGTIARQVAGRGLKETFDRPAATEPGAPIVTVTRNGALATLTWSQSNDGGSPVTQYQVYRATPAGERLLATLPGTTRRYEDHIEPGATYGYRVEATNAQGTSCGANAMASRPMGSSCRADGVLMGEDPAGDQKGAPLLPEMDIRSVSISEPYTADGARKLVFTLKVGSLAAPGPNQMWRLVWRYPDGGDGFLGRYYVGMNTDAGGVVSFEYGMIGSINAVLLDVGPPLVKGTPDAETGFAPDGTIRFVLAPDKIGNPEAGDLIGGLLARTYPVRQDETTRSDSAADTLTTYETYALLGNAACAPRSTCLEDDAAALTYSSEWHTVAHAAASGGSFRVAGSKSGKASLKFTFEVPADQTGALVYHFARSSKGGGADVYVDGARHSSLSYAAGSGKMEDPGFGAELKIEGLAAGSHTFELRNVVGAAYVDRFCLTSAATTGTAVAGPGTTSAGPQPLAALGTVLRPVTAGARTQSITALASGSGLLRLVVLDPAGAVLATADAVNGVASIEAAVSAAGTYKVKLVNLSPTAGSAWLAVTPYEVR